MKFWPIKSKISSKKIITIFIWDKKNKWILHFINLNFSIIFPLLLLKDIVSDNKIC